MATLGIVAALLAAGVLYQWAGARRNAARFTPPGRLIDVGGYRLHAVGMGAGSPPVLLESGIAASSLSWTVVQPAIARFTRVWAYDRAGLGWSDAPSRPLSFARIVADLAAVLEHVASGQRCILVGHSFGSFVVTAYAAAHPDRVAALVLVDPATEWWTIDAQRARLLAGGRRLSRLGAVLARLGVVRACLALLTGGVPAAPRGFVKAFGPSAARTLERLVGEVRKLPPEIHPVVQSIWCQPKCFRAMADHLEALEKSGEAIAVAAPPEIPVVVISSRDQPADQLEAHKKLADASVDGRHIVATQSAHWVQFDEPELIVNVVEALIHERPERPERPERSERS